MQLAKDFGRQAQFFQQFIIPILRLRIDQLRGCRIGIFIDHLPGQQIMQILRNHQEMFCLRQKLRLRLFYRHELIDGIKELLLNPIAAIQLALANHPVDFLVHTTGSAVTISDGIAEQFSLLIQQDEINAPGINGKACRNAVQLPALLYACLYFAEQMFNIPAKMAIFLDQLIFKAIDFFNAYLAVFQPAQNMPPAGGTDINGQIILTLRHVINSPAPNSQFEINVVFICFVWTYFRLQPHNTT